ncbi:MAG: hypothetical protein QM759_05630 [Terricaulis sp.]
MSGVVRIIIIVVIVALIAAGVVFFVLPNKASSSQTFTVERPASSVYQRLASTPPGSKIADGVTLTRITNAANNTVTGEVAYAEGKTGTVTYVVTPQGQNSQVQMTLDQGLGTNPLNKIQALTGGPVGPLVHTAADAVKADLTSLPNADFVGLQYDIVQVTPQPFFYIENCSANDTSDITSVITQAVAAIPAIMRTKGIQPSGPLMAVEPRVVQGQYCYQVGYPYSGPQPRGALLVGKAGQTPGGSMIHVHYTGVEADVVPQVYNKIDALLGAAHLDDPSTPNDDWPTYEVYNDDPTQSGGSHNREIYYVTRGDISRATAIVPPTAAAPAGAPAATAPAATDTTTSTATTTTTTTPAPAPAP